MQSALKLFAAFALAAVARADDWVHLGHHDELSWWAIGLMAAVVVIVGLMLYCIQDDGHYSHGNHSYHFTKQGNHGYHYKKHHHHHEAAYAEVSVASVGVPAFN